MKKIVLLFCLFLPFAWQASAQTGTDVDRKLLHDLLDERKQKFDTYSLSLEKRSGFFGNKTKNDIKHSNEVLIDIVQTDNRVISTLYRVVDFRTFEKVNMDYDIKKREETLINLRQATDTLSKQVDILTASNIALRKKSTKQAWWLYTISLFSLFIIIVLLRKRSRAVDN